MKKILIELGLALLLGVSLQAQAVDSLPSPKNMPEKFDPQRDAAEDIRAAVIRAQKEQKHILLDVGGQWCIWCRMLDTLYMRNPDLADYLYGHYVVVKVNVSKENKNEAVLARYPKVSGYPHLFVLDENGKLLRSEDTSELELPENSGVKGHDKAKVFAFLKKWAKE
jgi:thioredoxin-related protein